MKKLNIHFLPVFRCACLCFALWSTCASGVMAQDSLAIPAKPKPKLAKNTFGGTWIIDNQTVMVDTKKTFEFDIQHRFGIVNNGYSDLYGLFAPANIRLGFIYTPVNNLSVGIGICKERMQVDGSLKYALIKQSAVGGWPVSISVLGDAAVDTRDKSNFVTFVDRISYFSQLMIARKVTTKFSVQVAPSLTYFNNVEGYINSEGGISPKMNNSHFAIAFMGRYRLTQSFAVIADYDQPLTQHPTNNPHPNVSFGIDIGTISHTFQIFATNYSSILPESNNVFNQNDFTKGQWLIGFNISRNWYFQK